MKEYVAKSFKVLTRQSRGKWVWYLQDFYGECLDAGGGCITKRAASAAAAMAKIRYIEKIEAFKSINPGCTPGDIEADSMRSKLTQFGNGKRKKKPGSSHRPVRKGD